MREPTPPHAPTIATRYRLLIAVIIASQVFGKFEPSAMLLEREITEPLFEAVDQLQRGPASIAHQIASD